MKNILREYIRELLSTLLPGRSPISGPDAKLEMSSLAAHTITGTMAGPITPNDDQDDHEEDVTCSSFGGGKYKEPEGS